MLKNTHRVKLNIPAHLQDYVLSTMNPHKFIRDLVDADIAQPSKLKLIEIDNLPKMAKMVYLNDKQFAHVNRFEKPSAFVIALLDYNFNQTLP